MRGSLRTARRLPGREDVICALECDQLRLIGRLRDLSTSGFALEAEIPRHAMGNRFLHPGLCGRSASVELLLNTPDEHVFIKERVFLTRYDHQGTRVTLAGRFGQPLRNEWLKTFTHPPEVHGVVHIQGDTLQVEGAMTFRNAIYISRAANVFRNLKMDFSKVQRIDFAAVAATYNLMHKKGAKMLTCHPDIRVTMKQGKVCSICTGNCPVGERNRQYLQRAA